MFSDMLDMEQNTYTVCNTKHNKVQLSVTIIQHDMRPFAITP